MRRSRSRQKDYNKDHKPDYNSEQLPRQNDPSTLIKDYASIINANNDLMKDSSKVEIIGSKMIEKLDSEVFDMEINKIGRAHV